MKARASARALPENAARAVEISEEVPGVDSVVADASNTSAMVTPMMAQYASIKAAHPDCLLFYRMGDFFELFFDDAVQASRALGIQLTKRGRHQGEDIPMCGVPVVRSDEYLQKLIAAGFRIAVCEQLEDPAEAKKRGGKSVVKRDVIRLVTPGTITEDALLDAGANNLSERAVQGSRRGRRLCARLGRYLHGRMPRRRMRGGGPARRTGAALAERSAAGRGPRRRPQAARDHRRAGCGPDAVAGRSISPAWAGPPP